MVNIKETNQEAENGVGWSGGRNPNTSVGGRDVVSIARMEISVVFQKTSFLSFFFFFCHIQSMGVDLGPRAGETTWWTGVLGL